MPLGEILQGIEFNGKTGVLEVQGEDLQGEMSFANGAPRSASTRDGRSGAEAIQAMLFLEAGEFCLSASPAVDAPRTILASFTGILLDFSRAQDEQETPDEETPEPAAESAEELAASGEESGEETGEESAVAPPLAKPATSTGTVEEWVIATAGERSGAAEALRPAIAEQVRRLEAEAPSAPVGDAFLGRVLGVFRVDAFLESERDERRYLATHVDTGERVHLRVFPARDGRQATLNKLIRRGRQTLSVTDPRLDRCLAFGRSRRSYYVGYQVPVGETLAQRLTTRGPCAPDELVGILEGVARALLVLHRRNLAHGSVSPATIRVEPTGGVVLCGAGVARAQPEYAFLAGEGEALGAPGFVAPEVIDGLPPTPASDLYALGCVAWTALAGRAPFAGEDPLQVLLQQSRGEVPPAGGLEGVSVPDALAAVITKLTGREPRRRYRETNELLQDLNAIRHGGTVYLFEERSPAAPIKQADEGAMERERRRLGLVIALNLLLLLVTIGALVAGRAPLPDPTEGFAFELDPDGRAPN